MSDQERMDRWLRDAMAAGEPRLSSAFDARLAKRLRPRRLSSIGKLVMAVYIVAAIAISVWTLRRVPLEWSVGAVALLAPIAILATVYGRRLTRSA
jgi:hypothetical protein